MTPIAPPPMGAFPKLIGPNALVRMAFGGQDLTQLTQGLIGQMRQDPQDSGVLMDLATVLLCQGGDLAQQGLALQAEAVRRQPTYVVHHGSGDGLRLLAFVVVGDFMANTPLDFLLEGSDTTLILHYIDDLPPSAADVPDHDVAFLAVGESPQSARTLAAVGPALAQWPMPVLNNAPDLLAHLTRDRASRMLDGLPGVLAPVVHVVTRPMLVALAMGQLEPATLGRGLNWPLLVRPIGSHGGKGLDRLTDQMDLLRWLAQTANALADRSYLLPFVDYRASDGLFTKYRVAMIGGLPYASHMAQSNHWMVHYLNAEMDLHEDRRIEEAVWMAGFETVFARRHAQALEAIQRRLGLDYYAIDCAEAPDGRLLVFEVDTAMIIHDMDDETLYPYKKPAMRRLCDGFIEVLERATPSGEPNPGRRAA
jgi:hypothetical protein